MRIPNSKFDLAWRPIQPFSSVRTQLDAAVTAYTGSKLFSAQFNETTITHKHEDTNHTASILVEDETTRKLYFRHACDQWCSPESHRKMPRATASLIESL